MSESPARMPIVDAHAHAEAFFRDVDRQAMELPKGLAKVLEIAHATNCISHRRRGQRMRDGNRPASTRYDGAPNRITMKG